MTEMARSGAGEEAKKFVKQQEQKRRVKLYVLNEQRAWDDKGTGHVICAPFDAAGGLGLTVRSEVDNTVLLESKIQLDTAYQKQQETLIVWSEADNCDLALSFQEKLGCDEIWEKICQTYRVQYIQDVMLPAPSIFEENTLSSLSSFIFFNKVEIVSLIQDDDNFLQDLFSQLSATATPVNRRRELTLFLKEFAGFAQTLQPHARDGFFKSMSSYGALPAIQRSLSCGDEATKVASAAIFAMVVDYSPPMVREYMLMQAGETPPLSDEDLLMNILIKQLFSDEDPELSSAMQLLNILRILVDPENMMANAAQAKSEKLEFLSFFYKRCMSHLCGPLLECTDKQNDFKKFDDYHTANKMSLILEVLSFCMEHHTYNIRNFVISRDVLKRVLVLLQSKHAFLALGALRLFRRVVQLKEEFYYRHIVKQRLFDAIVKCWRDNGHRYNMKNSAMLELFEYIKTEDLKTLIACFIENYYEEFKDVDYVKTFSQLKLRYEQQQDRLNRLSGSPMVGGRKEGPPTPPLSSLKRGPRETDPDEEEWFAEDDEEWEDELPTSPDYPSVSVRTDRLPTSSGGPKTPPPPGVDGNNDGGRHSPPTSADLKGMPALQRMSSMTSNTDDFPSMMKHRNVVEADSVFSPGGTRPQFLSRLGAAGTRHPNPKISISIKSPLSVNSEVATETTNQQKPSSLADHSEASTSSAIISDYFEDFGRGLLGRFTGREDLLPGGFTGRIIREDFGRKRARESSSGGRVDQVSSSKSARAKDESAPASVVLTGIRQGSLVDYGYDSDSEEDDEWEEGEGTNLGSNQQQRGQNSSEEKKESPTPGISS